jgi:Fe2+ transport system protein FeoA
MLRNQVGYIEKIDDLLPEKITKRLFEMGLEVDQIVRCVRVPPIKGPKVFQISDSVFSLEKEIAEKIFVKEEI